MAENIFRLKRIAKKDPYVTPNTAVEKHIYDAVREGGGMPDASDYADGTALISVSGAFVPSAGYGYVAPDTIITWDGCYREGRDHFVVSEGQHLYVSQLPDEELPTTNFVAEAAAEYGGEQSQINVTFRHVGSYLAAESVYQMWQSQNGIMLTNVLSESFWAMVGAESLGTGLFILMTAAADVEDGDCVVPNDEIVGDLVYFDSFVLTITLPGGIQQIDRRLTGVPIITAGTTVYEDGVTDLADGAIYLQYEEE